MGKPIWVMEEPAAGEWLLPPDGSQVLWNTPDEQRPRSATLELEEQPAPSNKWFQKAPSGYSAVAEVNDRSLVSIEDVTPASASKQQDYRRAGASVINEYER